METSGWKHGESERRIRESDAAQARSALSEGRLTGLMKRRDEERLAAVLDSPGAAGGRIHVFASQLDAVSWLETFIMEASVGLLDDEWLDAHPELSDLGAAVRARAESFVADMAASGRFGARLPDRRGGAFAGRRHRDHYLFLAGGVPGMECVPLPDAAADLRVRTSGAGTFFVPPGDAVREAREEMAKWIGLFAGGSARWVNVFETGHESVRPSMEWLASVNCHFDSDPRGVFRDTLEIVRDVACDASGAVLSDSKWEKGVPDRRRAKVDFFLDSIAWQVHDGKAAAGQIAAHELLGHVGLEAYLDNRSFKRLVGHCREWRRRPVCDRSRKFAAAALDWEEEMKCGRRGRTKDERHTMRSELVATFAESMLDGGDFRRESLPDFHSAMGRLACAEGFSPDDALSVAAGGLERVLAKSDEHGIVISDETHFARPFR